VSFDVIHFNIDYWHFPLSKWLGLPPVTTLHGRLDQYLARVQIRNLRLGDAVVDLSLERHQRDVGVNVLNKAGEVEVSVVL
jgi:hypothetical protein